jgi:hypothetical protein
MVMSKSIYPHQPPSQIINGCFVESSLRSTDGRVTFTMQADGNVVLHQNGKPIWAANSQGKGGKRPYRLCMQKDGNVVAYDAENHPFWSSGSFRNPPYNTAQLIAPIGA